MCIKVLLSFILLLCCAMRIEGYFPQQYSTCNCDATIKPLETEIVELKTKIKELNEKTLNLFEELKQCLKSDFGNVLQDFTSTSYWSYNPILDGHLNCLENCEDIYIAQSNCYDIKEEGIYLLKTKNKESGTTFGAYCQKQANDKKGWLVIQRRQNGKVNFNRSWLDYKQGFGKANGEYWLGLDRIAVLTKNYDHELWIQIKTLENETYNARYGIFKISNEADGYKLHVRGFSSEQNLGDCLATNAGKEFSTYDKAPYGPNAEKRRRCAENEKSGWWFTDDCSLCNLNGVHYQFGSFGLKNGTYWKHGLSSEIIQYAHMAIRPITDKDYINKRW